MNFNNINIKLPSWLVLALANLMEAAEVIFGTPGSGPSKKAWVKGAALDLMDKVDIPVLPDIIEQPIKEALIDGAIDVIWALLFGDSGEVEQETSLDRLVRVNRIIDHRNSPIRLAPARL